MGNAAGAAEKTRTETFSAKEDGKGGDKKAAPLKERYMSLRRRRSKQEAANDSAAVPDAAPVKQAEEKKKRKTGKAGASSILSKKAKKEIADIKKTAEEINKFIESQKKLEEENKAKAIAFREKKKEKRERRKKQQGNGESAARKHANQLLSDHPTRGFWEHSCSAEDVCEWLYLQHANNTLPDSVLKAMEELENDEEKSCKAKHWRKVGEPVFKKAHPELFSNKEKY